MAPTNGYCTTPELKDRLLAERTYTASTLSFAASTKTITDTARGLKRFQTGDQVRISGSGSNDGYYTVATGNTSGTLVVTEALVNETAGASITISQHNDVVDDAVFDQVITAISRTLDDHTGRRFYAASETRYYGAEWSDLLLVDDLLSVSSLTVDHDGDRVYEVTWATTDYDLTPANAALDGKPYTRIEIAPQGRYGFPVGMAKGVKVAGSFGFSSTTPPAIKEACLLLAMRVFKRKDLVFGIAGSAELGQVVAIVPLDRDGEIRMLLAPFRRLTVGAI